MNHQTGDSQQFPAESHEGNQPTVRLLWMTPDPLGAIASMAGMYEGRVVRDLAELTHQDRMRALENTKATHLRAPMEAVKLHFLLENVDRAFTHQLVRQRTAVYAQESLRFAVPEGLPTSLPPSLEGTIDPNAEGIVVGYDYRSDKPQQWRDTWDYTLAVVNNAYHKLISDGMPAEEARGLLPHATLTRVQYVTDLRNLLEHAGNRLCTQAQFHWRSVFAQIAEEIRHAYGRLAVSGHGIVGREGEWYDNVKEEFGAIADLFKPICYQLNRCPFQASFDRECSIRLRVEQNRDEGRPSQFWHMQHMAPGGTTIEPIHDEEWLADPGAARA